MTKEQYQETINKIVANPDTIATAAVDLMNEITKDLDTLAGATAKVNSQADRIRDLQDSNYKLFLRVTGEPPDKKDPDSEHPFTDMLTDILKKEESDNGTQN